MPLRLPSAVRDRLAQRDAEILDGVMLIDVEVAGGAHRQIEPAVAREQLQHVIQEADPGADAGTVPCRRATRRSAIWVSLVTAFDRRRVAQHLFECGDARLRVFDDAGRDPQAARAAGIPRSIADVDAPCGELPHQRRGVPLETRQEHEIRRALQ